MVGFAVLATVGYMAYLLFDSIHAMYKDWRLGKEMNELETWSRKKKATDATAENSGSSPPPNA
jgi:hypothetical protein